jgi:hypothetical protein
MWIIMVALHTEALRVGVHGVVLALGADVLLAGARLALWDGDSETHSNVGASW